MLVIFFIPQFGTRKSRKHCGTSAFLVLLIMLLCDKLVEGQLENRAVSQSGISSSSSFVLQDIPDKVSRCLNIYGISESSTHLNM